MRRDSLPRLELPDRPWLDKALCRTREYRGLSWAATTLTMAEQRQQLAVCRACPVRGECERDAHNDTEPWGVRGGLVFRWYGHSRRRTQFVCRVCHSTVVAIGGKKQGHTTCSQECNGLWNAARLRKKDIA